MHPPTPRLLALALLLAAANAGIASAAPAEKSVKPAEKAPWQPVAELDTKRYAGHWYEIARLDHSFERGLVAVTADYELRADGKYKVTNTGRKKTLDGKPDISETLAWVPDPKKPGEFKARFFWFLGGEYQVMALGDTPDYGYALVGHPDLEHFWILAREPELGKETLDRLLRRAEALGYDTTKLIWVEQPRPAAAKKDPAK